MKLRRPTREGWIRTALFALALVVATGARPARASTLRLFDARLAPAVALPAAGAAVDRGAVTRQYAVGVVLIVVGAASTAFGGAAVWEAGSALSNERPGFQTVSSLVDAIVVGIGGAFLVGGLVELTVGVVLVHHAATAGSGGDAPVLAARPVEPPRAPSGLAAPPLAWSFAF